MQTEIVWYAKRRNAAARWKLKSHNKYVEINFS